MIFSEIIRKIFKEEFVLEVKSLLDSEIRSEIIHERYLRRLPRFREGTSSINGNEVIFSDVASFLHLRKDVFENEIYKFSFSGKDPVIIDCGSNIGLSVLYFITQFPEARIEAFEPDKLIFDILKRNLKKYSEKNINLHNKAVWSSSCDLEFISDNSDGGKIDETPDRKSESRVTISAIRLRDFLQKFPKIDFLKIDIEGAEDQVVPDCIEEISKVDRVFLEYHSPNNGTQQLHRHLELLSDAGFQYYSETANKISTPFNTREKSQSFEYQVNIYAYK